jgi:putative ABC transport system substrate-binding protein
MNRRTLISLLGGAAAWPMAGFAQRIDKVRRVGILANEPWPPLDGLRDGLRALGYIDGQNIDLLYRYSEGQAEKFVTLAAELVHLPVDAIVTWGTPPSLAAKAATGAIPIIMTSGDPIAVGLVPGLAYPGGNVTGLSTLAAELEASALN